MLLRSISALALSVALGWTGTAAAQTREQGAMLSRALVATAAGDWTEAEAIAERIGSPVAADIVLWTRLRDGAGEWSEYLDFLERHPDWPGIQAMRRGAERRMPSGLPPAEVFAYFESEPPQTGLGALRLSDALAADGREAEAVAEIRRAWTHYSMTAFERKAVLARWKTELASVHRARLDMLLWRGLTAEAEAMLSLVGPDWQRLAQARIATRRDAAGLQYLINTVPAALEDDPGLVFERYLYRVNKGRWQDAEDYILAASTSAEALGRPDLWMERRANLARQALEDGDVAGAYRIAARSFGSEGADYADAEWVAGFVALTRMDDAATAVEHFRRFQSLVATPISLGRAGYWLGRAYERTGDADAAAAAYRAGARHQTSFYGQLAAAKLGSPADPTLAGGPTPPRWRGAPFMRTSVVEAGFLLHLAGEDVRAMQFLRHAAEGRPPAVRAALAQMALDIGEPAIGIRIAKDAAAEGVIIPDQYYPLHRIAAQKWKVPTEYAMAIARQESELDAGAGSGAGARGLMQLMPATAERMAEMAGVRYEPAKLTADPVYNARLGTEYLARMLDRYDGSFVLATAAYNAGPGRVDDWIEANGDPRAPGTDAVTWIESIPFSETRNYVMRVLEGLHVYRARLNGRPTALQLVADLDAGSEVHVSTRDFDLSEASAVE